LALVSTVSVLGSSASAVCTYPCQNGGSCVLNSVTKQPTCQCAPGFVGVDCARRGCASNCNHVGYCDLSSTPPSCLCYNGYGGLDCELSVTATPVGSPTTAGAAGSSSSSTSASGSTTSTSTSSSANGTGTTTGSLPVDRTLCTPSCNPVNGVCWQGACACANGFTGKTCSDYLCPDDCSNRGICNKTDGVCECFEPYIGATCAGQSHPVVPRLPDTYTDDIHGPAPLTAAQKAVLPQVGHKKGESDAFHLIEQAATMHMQQQEEGADYESLVN